MASIHSSDAKFSHGIMFHHFHDEGKPEAQGSITPDEFRAILDWLYREFNLLNAKDYFERAVSGKLNDADICLTFDDALSCQFRYAAPILKEYDITAFFFIYSAPFFGELNMLEIYRYFRCTQFDNIDDFYRSFFKHVRSAHLDDYESRKDDFKTSKYLDGYSFYSENDKWFRYLRDQVLGKESYEGAMSSFMIAEGFEVESASGLWMNGDNLKHLHAQGHMLGLHSYSHPTFIENLSRDIQANEYYRNHEHLKSIVGHDLKVMSHPNGNYSSDTLDILKDMEVKIGFGSNMAIKEGATILEIPRDDHANILKKAIS